MAAVLRATGRDFDVDAFLAGSALKPCRVFRRGEPRFSGSQPGGPTHQKSGLNVVVSAADFREFRKQVAGATAFLLAEAAEIQRLRTSPGVEDVTLDFGIERRHVVVQSDHLPADLIRAAGALGLGIELSQYPPPDAKDEQSPS